MKDLKINISYKEYELEEELTLTEREMIARAREAAAAAYAPYSGFKVGAAVLLGNGMMLTGNNQENAAYPSGLCAERVALFSAAAHHPGVPVIGIAISLSPDAANLPHPIPPCGACRQALIEYEDLGKTSIRVILAGNNGKILVFNSISDLLPFSFTRKELL